MKVFGYAVNTFEPAVQEREHAVTPREKEEIVPVAIPARVCVDAFACVRVAAPVRTEQQQLVLCASRGEPVQLRVGEKFRQGSDFRRP